MSKTAQEASYVSPPYQRDGKSGGIRDSNSPLDSPLDGTSNRESAATQPRKRSAAAAPGEGKSEDDNSKWIHRDKLARIESEELQAAGIILPGSRNRGKPRRASAVEKASGNRTVEEESDSTPFRPLKSSVSGGELRSYEPSTPAFDLRLPEEIAMDSGNYFTPNNSVNGGSRIPVAKLSPLPIPNEHIERDTPRMRSRESTPGEENKITIPKTRSRSGSAGTTKTLEKTISGGNLQAKRSATDVSPKKPTGQAGARKGSAPTKAAGGPNGGKKVRGAPSKDSTSSSGGQTRPSTRSGELSPAGAKVPEGDPPWMVSAYKPDPRLPPDQQLLPTVARRLQQEKWEKEGKVSGNVFDKEFRPLTDEGLPEPPELEPEIEPSKPAEKEKPADWPLTPDMGRQNFTPVAHPNRTGSYSTIPKIQEKPPLSPLASPRGPVVQGRARSPVVRVPDDPQEDQAPAKKGCACCIVM
jgi:hypothetical protein